jgi:hypothetical protein
VGSVAETVRDVRAGRIPYEDGLDRLVVAPAPEADAALEAALRHEFLRLFGHGWQPDELQRVVGRRGEPRLARMVADGAAAYVAGFDRSRVDPRWRAQTGDVWWTGPYLTAAAQRYRADRVSLIDAVLRLLEILSSLPVIEVLLPPPGEPGADATPGLDAKVRARVRALLAKAEATGFPAEAEAYAAKAQELIARNRLDDVRAAPPAAVPEARRIGVDHPYENEKAALLDAVATANGCTTVWSPELAFSTVFGFAADLDAVAELYASLLIQMDRAAGREKAAKAFRRSFMIAYAARISERLTAAAAAPEAGDLLPVLVSREAQVRDTARRAFPQTVRSRGRRAESLDGWESGQAAADRAEW